MTDRRREHAPEATGAAGNQTRQQGRAITAPPIMPRVGAFVKVRVEAASDREQSALAELVDRARWLATLAGEWTTW
jgi:hypothetical protein